MMFYFSIILIVFLLMLISTVTKSKKIKKVTIILSCLILILVSAYRYNVGTDYNTYHKWYLEVLGEYYKVEFMYIPFQIFMTCLGFISENSFIFFLVTSIIINILMFKFIIENQENHLLGIMIYICLFFYFSTFNLVRQWISVSLCLYSIKFIKQNKFSRFLLTNILAVLTHYTAIIFFPLYFISKTKISRLTPLFITFITFIMFKVLNIWKHGLNLIKYIHPFYYDRYISMDESNVNGIFYFLISSTLVLFYCVFYKKLLIKYGEKELNIRHHLLTFCSIFCLLSTVSQVLNRLSLYFVPMLIIFLPDCLIVFKNKKIKILFMVIGLLLLILYCIKLLNANIHKVLPYSVVPYVVF